jgi:glutamate--cysteine ligase
LVDAMATLVSQVEQGRSPADEFSDQVVDRGVAAAVSHLAKGVT